MHITCTLDRKPGLVLVIYIRTLFLTYRSASAVPFLTRIFFYQLIYSGFSGGIFGRKWKGRWHSAASSVLTWACSMFRVLSRAHARERWLNGAKFSLSLRVCESSVVMCVWLRGIRGQLGSCRARLACVLFGNCSGLMRMSWVGSFFGGICCVIEIYWYILGFVYGIGEIGKYMTLKTDDNFLDIISVTLAWHKSILLWMSSFSWFLTIYLYMNIYNIYLLVKAGIYK